MIIRYRKAKISDLPSIINIYNEVIDSGGFTADLEQYSVEQKISWFEKTSQYPYGIFVITKEYNTIGYFYFSPWREGRKALLSVAEISFYLSQSYRNKGYGNFIIQSALKEAKENRIKSLIAVLLDINTRSKKLLEKFNFTIVGEIPEIADLDGQKCGQLIMLRK